MAIDFFKNTFNPTGQGTMFGQQTNSQNTFYDSLVNQYGLTDEGMLNLSLDLGNKEDAPKLIESIFKYNNIEPKENAITEMMDNPGFIMGLSLMNQAATGKSLGAALMPAATTTQGFIANQDLRKQNKKLMRMKETDQVRAISKDISQLATEEGQRDLTAKQTKKVISETSINDIKKELVQANIEQTIAQTGQFNAQTDAIRENIKLDQLTYDMRNKPFQREMAAINTIAADETLSDSRKAYYLQNPSLYGSIDESARLTPTSGAISKSQKLIGDKFVDNLVEKIPGYDSTRKDELRGELVDSIAKKATETALYEFNNGKRSTRDVTSADVDAAYSELIKSGEIQEAGFWQNLVGGRIFGLFQKDASGIVLGNRLGGDVEEGKPTIVGEDGPEVFVPLTDGKILSNPKTAGGYTWEDAIIDSSEMLAKIKQSSGAEEAKKALKKFRPDLYI